VVAYPMCKSPFNLVHNLVGSTCTCCLNFFFSFNIFHFIDTLLKF